MKEYMVSLVFITHSSVKEDQMLKIFNSSKIELSCRDVNTDKLWGLKLDMDNKESIIEQIESITSLINTNALANSDKLFKSVYFDIGICYDTFTCTVGLKNDLLKKIFDILPQINIEITCYPTDFNI